MSMLLTGSTLLWRDCDCRLSLSAKGGGDPKSNPPAAFVVAARAGAVASLPSTGLYSVTCIQVLGSHSLISCSISSSVNPSSTLLPCPENPGTSLKVARGGLYSGGIIVLRFLHWAWALLPQPVNHVRKARALHTMLTGGGEEGKGEGGEGDKGMPARKIQLQRLRHGLLPARKVQAPLQRLRHGLLPVRKGTSAAARTAARATASTEGGKPNAKTAAQGTASTAGTSTAAETAARAAGCCQHSRRDKRVCKDCLRHGPLKEVIPPKTRSASKAPPTALLHAGHPSSKTHGATHSEITR
jgi:hypothetical protein